MQDDPIKLPLKPPGTKLLELKYGETLSNFAFNFDMCRYMKGGGGGDEEGGDHTHRVHAPPGRMARLGAFTAYASAYASGCLVILLSNLEPHADGD